MTRQDGEVGHGSRTGCNKSHIKYFNCDLYGHYASECESKRRGEEAHLTHVQEEEDQELLLAMSTASASMESCNLVLLNEEKVEPRLRVDGETHVSSNEWYFNNKASNHMTCEWNKFHDLDSTVKGHIKFGDGSTMKIKGKGTMLFKFKGGEQRLLTEVYYIPNLCSNTISIGHLTEA